MKKVSSKLVIRKETVRTLDRLEDVMGGLPTTTIATSRVDACPTRPCNTPLPQG